MRDLNQKRPIGIVIAAIYCAIAGLGEVIVGTIIALIVIAHIGWNM